MIKKRHRKNRHIFFSSFLITLILTISLITMVKTDYNCRYITTGDTKPPIDFSYINDESYITVNSFGINKSYDITEFVNTFKKMLQII